MDSHEDEAAELLAKDRRIDELIEQGDRLISDLNATVIDMKRILAAASETIETQRHRGGRGKPGGW